jgi:hypothetical protein
MCGSASYIPFSTSIVVAVVSTSCVQLLIVCLLAAVLILWRFTTSNTTTTPASTQQRGRGSTLQSALHNKMLCCLLRKIRIREKMSEKTKFYATEIEVSFVLYSSVNEIPVSQCSPGEIKIATPIAHHCKGGEIQNSE